jgi:N-acetylneuraminate synthase
MVRAAHASGAWAVKFQLYKTEELVIRESPKYWSDDLGTSTQFQAFKKSDKLSYSEYREIAEECSKLGIIFFATPFDQSAVQALEDIEVPLYKVASGDITYRRLLESIGETQKPVLLSTGASTRREIHQAIEWLGGDSSKICVLACTLTYPTPDVDGNFARIPEFKKEFKDFLIGFSDHTIGDAGGWMTAALGGSCIEKHFTLDKTLGEVPDHVMSVDPLELTSLVKACNRATILRGSSDIDVSTSERPALLNARRSVVSVKPISAGTMITSDMLTAKRPGIGISAAELDHVVGRIARVDIKEDAVVFSEDLI